MTQPKILIAGAAGSTGKIATQTLLDKGLPVRALVRKEDERSNRLKALGAEVVVGDLLDFRAVRSVFEGVKRAYFVYPMRPGIVQATTHFAQAALDAKAEHIVNISQRTAGPNAESNSALQHWLAEQVFDWAGTPVTHLRPTMFHDWLLYMRPQIRDGRFAVPFGPTGRFATISSEDQGAVIAEILANPEQHTGHVYELFGPEEMTAPQIAEVAGRVLGHEVRYEQISGEQWVRNLHGDSIPFLAQHLDGIAIAQDRGGMAGTNDVVEKIIGRRPVTLSEFIEKHRQAFQ
jgi:NAD(P)H dehydrogenase (quinone)